MKDIEKYLNAFPIATKLYQIPLSKITDAVLEHVLFDQLLLELPPSIILERHRTLHSKRIQIISNLFIDLHIIIITKVLRTPHDAQILLGKLWWYSQTEWKIIVFVYDPAGFFRRIPDADPSQYPLILHPRPHVAQSNQFDRELMIKRGGFSLYDAQHPAMQKIDDKIQEFNFQINQFSPAFDPHPSRDHLTGIFQKFPFRELLADPEFIDPIIHEERELTELPIEWLVSKILRALYPDRIVNQYRTDHHIFDLYFDDRLIIEIKYLKQRNEYFRLIGQLWEYSCYGKEIIAFIINPKKIFKLINGAFPPNCSIILI